MTTTTKTTATEGVMIADETGWQKTCPTLEAARRAATYRARWSGKPCHIEGDFELTTAGMMGWV